MNDSLCLHPETILNRLNANEERMKMLIKTNFCCRSNFSLPFYLMRLHIKNRPNSPDLFSNLQLLQTTPDFQNQL